MLSEKRRLKMRIALIATPYPLEEYPSPPLGISYVAAAFEAAGCEVRVWDYIVSSYSKEKIVSQLEEFQPDAVGAGSVTMNFLDAQRILKDVKSYNRDILTLIGGPHVSFMVEPTLNGCPQIDLVFIGESEATIAELVPVLHQKNKWHAIAGIAFRDNGGIVNTGRRDFIMDLDGLPLPARHLLPLSRYRALGFPVSMITGRGCPHSCIFCLGRRMVGSKLRRRSAARVVDEMEKILELGFDRINIADDLFASDTDRVKAICRDIKDRGLKIGWSAFARVDTVTQEMLDEMRSAGCDTVSFGIESGSPEMLKRARKGITLAKAVEAIRMCKQSGIKSHASFIAGLPGETPETLAQTDAFARSLDTLFGYHYLVPFPGTTIREEKERFDIQFLTDDWNQYHANDAIVRTSAVSAQDLRDFVAVYDAEAFGDWNKMLEAYGKGTNTPLDEMRVAGHHRMNITFSILKQEWIEKLGFIDSASLNGNPEAAKKMLVDKVVSHIEGDTALVRHTVEDFISRGYLKPDRSERGVYWRWS
jgi:anaerobic magnesium-protoporphyrin IX monomethyl ester cyclase